MVGSLGHVGRSARTKGIWTRQGSRLDLCHTGATLALTLREQRNFHLPLRKLSDPFEAIRNSVIIFFFA